MVYHNILVFQTLQLEVPCNVKHSLATYEQMEDDDYDMRQIPTPSEDDGIGGKNEWTLL